MCAGHANLPTSTHPSHRRKTLKRLHLCLFQVAHLSRYIQGYRVFYRTIGSSWSVQDVDAASDHNVILTDLQSATEYEVKIRPYFNELQGQDSLMVLLRMPDEGEKASSMFALATVFITLGSHNRLIQFEILCYTDHLVALILKELSSEWHLFFSKCSSRFFAKCCP